MFAGRIPVSAPALIFFGLLTGPTTADAAELRPGVVVSPESELVFLMKPGGGIEAVSSTAGETQWLGEQGDKPLTAEGDRLLTLVDAERPGVMTLVSLDANSGRQLKTTRLDVAPDVWVKVDDGLSTRFSIQADGRSTDDKASLAWSYRSWTAQGAKTDEPVPNLRDLRTTQGQLTYGWSDGEAALQTRRATEAPKPAVLLEGDKALQGVGEGRQFLSRDERHVIVSRRVAAEPARFKYQWTVHTRQGERVGSLQAETSYSPFMVLDSVLLVESPAGRRRADAQSPWVESPLSVRAVDLVGGTELWSRSIRETRYQGPLPP